MSDSSYFLLDSSLLNRTVAISRDAACERRACGARRRDAWLASEIEELARGEVPSDDQVKAIALTRAALGGRVVDPKTTPLDLVVERRIRKKPGTGVGAMVKVKLWRVFSPIRESDGSFVLIPRKVMQEIDAIRARQIRSAFDGEEE